MKKYTDTELLEALLPMLYYSISTSTIGDTKEQKALLLVADTTKRVQR